MDRELDCAAWAPFRGTPGGIPPWRWLSSYGAGQLLGKALHELRFRLYGLCPVLGRLAAVAAVPGQAPPPDELRPLDDWLRPLVAPPPGRGCPGLLTFAGETHEHRPSTRWAPTGSSRLYRFHLHYMDWVASLALAEGTRDLARDLLDDWIERNPPGSLEGWHPYPTALRLVNLVSVWGLLAAGQPRPRLERWVRSLWTQAWFLARHRESFLGGNHLLEDDLALVAAGLFFGGRARGLRRRAERHLAADLAAQVLPDGGHAEGSYGYHVRLWRRVERLAAARRGVTGSLPAWLEGAAGRMEGFARRLTAGLEEPPLFGDSWASAELPWSAEPPASDSPPQALLFPSSSLARIPWGGRGDLALVRWGGVGAPGVPGHGHGDCGGYELFAGGRRVVADGGNVDYVASDLRAYFRSTRAHSTARVGDREQSELVGAFRAGRTTSGRLVSFEAGPRGRLALAWQPVGQPVVTHRRVVEALEEGGLLVGDGCWPERDDLVSMVHLAPGVAVVADYSAGAGAFRLDLGGRSLWLVPLRGSFGGPEAVPFAPDFGVVARRTRIGLRGARSLGYAIVPRRPGLPERSRWEGILRERL